MRRPRSRHQLVDRGRASSRSVNDAVAARPARVSSGALAPVARGELVGAARARAAPERRAARADASCSRSLARCRRLRRRRRRWRARQRRRRRPPPSAPPSPPADVGVAVRAAVGAAVSPAVAVGRRRPRRRRHRHRRRPSAAAVRAAVGAAVATRDVVVVHVALLPYPAAASGRARCASYPSPDRVTLGSAALGEVQRDDPAGQVAVADVGPARARRWCAASSSWAGQARIDSAR